MSAKRESAAPPERIALYEAVVASIPEIERKGASIPYTSVNGHMFSYLNALGSVALRLPEGTRERFLKQYETHLVEAYGIVQKEYVTVPDALLERPEELRPYIEEALAYVKSLKPKPSKREKSS